ncbi:hypothetical protein [Xylophilus sp. GOD-11R]|uniref:hypothetical protein n=1 Tax=Xylophilus sp. GOD-11R TaxID=3089814 RepID=UPI00298D1E58|nr:hypothetical protein [Xylophilus sp. GOD-11R]WPB58003.1 hypothetical protein R9X41_04985 [Xylophilus sp. GOD-11R]
MNQKTWALAIATAAIGAASHSSAMAQTTTSASTGLSSPAARDAQGHATDSTTPMAHPKGSSNKASSGTGMTTSGNALNPGSTRTTTTPPNTTPGAGLRNSGDATPPTSGAAGR